MGADATAAPSRVRLLLLVLLGVAVLAFFATRAGGPAVPGQRASTPQAGRAGTADAPIDPARLDVRLEALAHDRPSPADTERNPFTFQAPAPPPAPDTFGPPPAETLGAPAGRPGPPAATAKPITVRFIGVLERSTETIAIFVDCTEGRRTPYAREGEIVDGRYRLIRIGAESVVIEHLDGTGRTTLAKNGQECVR